MLLTVNHMALQFRLFVHADIHTLLAAWMEVAPLGRMDRRHHQPDSGSPRLQGGDHRPAGLERSGEHPGAGRAPVGLLRIRRKYGLHGKPLFRFQKAETAGFLHAGRRYGKAARLRDGRLLHTQAFATSQIKRVFIDTSWQPYDTAVLKKTGQIRVKGGVKSQIITEAAAGETVDVLETMDKWSRVRTADGYIGYVENRKLEAGEQVAPVSTFEAPVYTSISMDGKVRLGFHQVTRQEGNNTLEDYASNARGMNVIVPTWFNVVSSDGTYTSLASKDYVDKAHDMGLKVWAMVENVSTQESIKNLNTKTLMSSTSTRKKLIEKLMNEADTYGFDGFNLDFESLKAEAGPHYVQFIREMSVACRNKGLVLSVDNYVPSSYTAFYNRKEQGIVADYVIVMGYDEHYAGGEAGSVSSIPYVREGIENTLKEVPKEKVINAVPFYTRVWTVNEGKTSSKAYGISDARQWVEENQVELTWDKLLGQYYGETVSGSGQQYIWMEEEDSMRLKIDLIKEFDLAGVACWKLGFEPADIWDIVSEVK